jgi:hypothetical protein
VASPRDPVASERWKFFGMETDRRLEPLSDQRRFVAS